MELVTQRLDASLSRRALLRSSLKTAGCLALVGMVPQPVLAMFSSEPDRKIALANLHTGESCNVTYWQDGDYVSEAMASIQNIMRDHRNNEEHAIDPALLDLLVVLHGKLETNAPLQVVSGYRSPASNAAMHARSSGVASRSLHMFGRAIDIRVQGRGVKQIHQTALAMKLGGVGYYPTSDFVHVDTGKVRQWAGA